MTDLFQQKQLLHCSPRIFIISGCLSPNPSFCTDLEVRWGEFPPAGRGSLNRPQRVKRNLKPQVCSHCEVTQTASQERRFELPIFLIHRKVRNVRGSPLFNARVWWPSQCSSVVLKENFPKETPWGSSEIGGVNQMLGCEEYFWISSFPLLFLERNGICRQGCRTLPQ